MNHTGSNTKGNGNAHLGYLKTLGLVILVAAIFTLIIPRIRIDVETGDEALAVVCVSGNLLGRQELACVEMPYDEIAGMELVETEIPGEFVNGFGGRQGLGTRYDAGVWDFADYGGYYELIIREDVPVSILVTGTDGRRVLFNFESADSTDMLYKALTDLLGR